MRIVFAAPAGLYRPLLETAGVQHYLATYYNPVDYRAAIKTAQAQPGTCTLIVDSGAFSAWNSGKSIDVVKYAAFIRQFQQEHGALFRELIFVNLDVIPGAPGQTITHAQGIAAAEQGFRNYEYLLKETHAAIMPVYHQGEDLSWCQRYLDINVTYFGISPSNDIQTERRAKWLDVVFPLVPDTVRVHGLAVTSPALMYQYPWFSVDSITYKMKSGMGGFMLLVADPEPRLLSYDHSTRRCDLPLPGPGRDAIQQVLTALDPRFTLDGLRESYQLRCEVNIQSFLALERWINSRPCPKAYQQQPVFNFA